MQKCFTGISSTNVEEQLKEYNIDYVKMSIIEDEKESPALLTWSAEDAHKMFRNMQLCIPWNI